MPPVSILFRGAFYARMSVEEYTQWVDKIMSFNTVDAARTTSLPLSDEGPVLASWDDILNKPIKGRPKSTKSKVGS